jgi:hypothetical protein
MVTPNDMQGLSVRCEGSRPAARAQRAARALRRALIREVSDVRSLPRAPHRVPAVNAGEAVGHHRPATARARAAETLCSSRACCSRGSAFKKRGRFGETRAAVPRLASEVMAMLLPVPSSTSAHTANAALWSAGAVPSAAPNPRFERTRGSVIALRLPPCSAKHRERAAQPAR